MKTNGAIDFERTKVSTLFRRLFFPTLLGMLSVSAVTVALNVVILLFPERTAYLLGASDHLRPMVVDYLLWFMPSLVFELWIAVAMFALRLDGAPRLAMWCSIVAAAVNVVFDWLFIFHWHWGVKGAALATSVSCLIGALMAVGYLVLLAGSMRLHPLRISWRGAVFFFHNIGVQCKIGSSALLGEATMAVLMFTGNHVFMSQWGDAGVGAFGVSCYYLPFVFMTGNAIAQSAQPIISYNFGMGNGGRIREALRVSLWAAAVCGAVSSAAFMLFPELLVSLFLNPADEAAVIAIAGFPYYGTAFVFFILNLSVIGYYQSIESIGRATVLALLRGFIFLIPCFILMPRLCGETGVWLALPASEILTSAVIVGLCLYRRVKA